jgi:hypothetical protein
MQNFQHNLNADVFQIIINLLSEEAFSILMTIAAYQRKWDESDLGGIPSYSLVADI